MNFENTYWNDNGRYQVQAERLHEAMPGYGMDTDNDLLNLGMALSSVYYDAHNNGGCNLRGDGWSRGMIQRYIYEIALPIVQENQIPLSMRLDTKEDTLYRNLTDAEKVEKLLDSYFAYISDKSLTCDMMTLYVNWDDNTYSYTERDTHHAITFSSERMRDEWLRDGRLTELVSE